MVANLTSVSSDTDSIFYDQMFLSFGEQTFLDVPEDTDGPTFERALGTAGRVGKASNWWIGDLLVFGEAKWGEELAQFYPEDMAEQTIANCRWVSSIYAKEDRFAQLTWSHHRIAGGLDYTIRQSALKTAIEDLMSTLEFEKFVKQLKNEGGTATAEDTDLPESVTKMISFKVDKRNEDAATTIKEQTEAYLSKKLREAGIERLG